MPMFPGEAEKLEAVNKLIVSARQTIVHLKKKIRRHVLHHFFLHNLLSAKNIFSDVMI
jgi:hypothetical protein